jgi:hypothetical protein
MSEMVTLPVAGLLVDPNPLVTGRRGALRQADDVIFERPGQATSRPAFRTQYVKPDTDGGAFRPVSAYMWDGACVISSRAGSNWRIEYVNDEYPDTGASATPPDINVAPMQFVEARKNLYYTTAAGVRKRTSLAVAFPSSSTGVQTRGANLYGFAGSGGQLGGSSSNGFAAAYRFCVVSEDRNKYRRRSAPTERIIGSSTISVSNDKYGLSGRYYLEPSWVAGDILEMYRTKIVTPGTAAPSEEYYLAQEWVLTSADISTGYVQFQDNVLDENLGAALYTNPSQGGIEDANEIPPKAHFLAQHQDCTWFGHTSHRQRWTNQFRSAGGDRDGTPDVEWRSGDGFCRILEDATFSAGATTLSVTDATGIAPGMFVCYLVESPPGVFTGWPYENGTYFSSETKVVSVSGSGPYTVTIDKPTLAASGGSLSNVMFCDWISITQDSTTTIFPFLGHTITALYGGTYRSWGAEAYTGGNTYDQDQDALALSLAYVINRYGVGNPSFKVRAQFISGVFGNGGAAGNVVLESVEMGASAFTVTTSRPNSFLKTIGTGSASDPLARANRVYYSKPFEPEAVPIGNFLSIGSEAHPIQAMVPAGDNLYVFKTDGLYRISGQAPRYWRVEQVSPDVKLVRGGAACAVDDSVVAWCDHGVVSVRDLSITSLSDGRINTALSTHLSSLLVSGAVAFVTYWPTKNLILVGGPHADGPGGGADIKYTQYVYVYNISANQWSRWTIPLRFCVYDLNSRELFAGVASAAWDVRRTEHYSSGHDAVYEDWVTEYEAGETVLEVDVSDIGAWIPKVGDWILYTASGEWPGEVPTTWLRIEGVQYDPGSIIIDDDPSYLLTLSGPTPYAGFVTGYETIITRLWWQAHAVSPARSALYREVQPQLVFFYTKESGDGPDDWRLIAGASGDHVVNPDTATYVEDDKPEVASFTRRVGLSRNIARTTHIYPYVEVGEPCAMWACMGVVLQFDVSSEKSRR